MEEFDEDFRFWCEWKSWALPLKLSFGDEYVAFEIQVGPFGFTLFQTFEDADDSDYWED